MAGSDRLSGPIFLTSNVAGARVPPPIRIDGNATEPRTGTTVVAPVPAAAFDAKIGFTGKFEFYDANLRKSGHHYAGSSIAAMQIHEGSHTVIRKFIFFE